MIKLKSLIFEEKTKIHSLVSNWKNKKAQDYASKLIEKYGEPDVEGGEMLLWEDLKLVDEENYEYKVKKVDKVYILDESIKHSFPAEHIDYCYSVLKISEIQAKGGESTGVPGLNANMSNNQMMNKIEDNPGITAFFPPKMGMISGPGGPKDDKIPAMLSDGEFVFTAKAVDNAGGPKAMYNMMNKLDPESSKGRGII